MEVIMLILIDFNFRFKYNFDMKYLYRICGVLLFIVHSVILFIILFGEFFPKIWIVYFSILILTLLSELYFGYCIVSKWEFDLRKKINPKINYDYNWATFYTYKFTQNRISELFFKRATVIFLVTSLVLNIYLKFIV